MSKTCSICNSHINFISEYKLKENSNLKICFECYELLVTALRGEITAVETIKQRYKDNISDEITEYISSIEAKINDKNPNTVTTEKNDDFMDLMSNNIKPEEDYHKQENHSVNIHTDITLQEKATSLQRVKIISKICYTGLLLIVPILSLYLLIVVKSPLNASLTLFFGSFITILFYLVYKLTDSLFDEKNNNTF